MTKNKDIKKGLFMLLITAILIAVVYYFYNSKNTYDWSENFKYDNDQPYGADLFYSFLKDYNDLDSISLIEKQSLKLFLLQNELLLQKKDSSQKASYIFIGKTLKLSQRDCKSLIEFIRNGNSVMLISENIDNKLYAAMQSSCSPINFNSVNYSKEFTINANFESAKLNKKKGYRFFYEYKSEQMEHDFAYFGSKMCRTIEFQTLGTIRPNRSNFIRMSLGKGQLLLHSNPIFFTNRHLIREDGLGYASKVLAYLPKGPIYWDKLNKARRVKKPDIEGNEDDGPFNYILKQRGLKWALYLSYFTVILFLIFNLFRKQKEIPVKFLNKNTSLEFIKNVGNLYYVNKDNKKLAAKIMQHFMNEVRLKYKIKEKSQNAIIEKLSQKTKVEPSLIKAIINSYTYIEKKNELSDNGLILFYLKIEKFHNAIKK